MVLGTRGRRSPRHRNSPENVSQNFVSFALFHWQAEATFSGHINEAGPCCWIRPGKSRCKPITPDPMPQVRALLISPAFLQPVQVYPQAPVATTSAGRPDSDAVRRNDALQQRCVRWCELAAGRGDVVDSPGVFPPENLFLLGQVVPEPPFRGDDQGKRLNAGWQLQGRREPCPRVVSGACLRGSPVQWGCHAAFLAACAASPDLGEVPETGWIASLNDRCPHIRARLFLALPRWG